jgi:hypothetical protein
MMRKMHTNPPSDRRRPGHRSFIVVPLFLAVCAASVHGALPLHADVLPAATIEAGKDRRTVALPSGAQVLVLPGGSLTQDEPRLVKGEALFSHASLIRVQAGDLTVEGWNGAFSATVQGESVTVAALTTPVVVRDGLKRAVVPVGTQLRILSHLAPLEKGMDGWLKDRSPLPLPAFYVRERLTMLESLPRPVVLPQKGILDAPLSSVLDALRLPAAQERADAERREHVLDTLVSALHSRDSEAVQSLLLDPAIQSALQAPAGKAALPDIAALAVQQDMLPLFLPIALSDDSLWLLAFSHEALRDHAWVSEGVWGGDSESRLVRLFIFPRTDTLAQGSAPLAVERWQEEVSAYLKAHAKEAPALLDLLMPAWVETVRLQASLDLPERTQRYTDALDAIAAPYLSSLSAATAHSLTDARTESQSLSAVQLQSESSSSAMSSARSSAPERVMGVFDTEQGKEKALEMLRAAGGTETDQTSVSVVQGYIVHVTGMVFPSDAGDLAMEFTFDAGSRQVSAIVKDGKVLPYSVGLDQFTAWVHKGMQ